MNNIHLLIVDDEERFLNTTKSLFEKRGVITSIATNGPDAISILNTERIDVVVLDVKMPGLDGIEALRLIKKRLPLVEVIMLTGHASAETAVEGLNLGAFDYLMKPCDIPMLLEKVNQAYARKQANEQKVQKKRSTGSLAIL